MAHFSCLWHPEYLRPPLRRRESALSKREKIYYIVCASTLKNSSFASVASVLELEPTECRSSEGLGACYSWCLTAPSRSWWSGGSWWALGVCGSPKTRRLYTMWTRRSGDGEEAFLVITFSLVKQGSYTLVWVLQRGLGGASTPRYHGKKSGCLVSLTFISSN